METKANAVVSGQFHSTKMYTNSARYFPKGVGSFLVIGIHATGNDLEFEQLK